MKHILLILLFAALLTVASCSRTDDARLAVAERQMAEHPDSALLTLRQIDATSLNRHNTALYGVSRNLVGINFRHPNVMPNFAVWKTITYRHWHKWCCQPRF